MVQNKSNMRKIAMGNATIPICKIIVAQKLQIRDILPEAFSEVHESQCEQEQI